MSDRLRKQQTGHADRWTATETSSGLRQDERLRQPQGADPWTAAQVFEATAALSDHERSVGLSKAAADFRVPPEARAQVRALTEKPEFGFQQMLDVTKRRTLLEQLQLHEQLRRYAYVPDGVKEARAKGIDPGAFIAGNGRKNNAFGEPNGQERITEAGLADARRALTVPREVTKKLDSLTEREFNWGEATKAVEHLQLPARVSALSALKGRTYVPPGVSEAQAKGLDPSGFRCGKGHERVMLGKDRIESARDLDAATEGIRTMGVKSADATLAILSFGFGPAMQAGLAMKGARAATRAGGAAGPAGTAVHSIRGGYNAFTLRSGLDVALPAIEQGAEVLSVLDPDHAHIYGGIGAVSGLASSFRSLSKAGTMKGGAAVAQTISGAAGMVDAGLSAGEAVVGKPQDEAQRLRLLQLHSALKGVKEVSGSAAKGLTDPLAP